jgi:hypothetical protein
MSLDLDRNPRINSPHCRIPKFRTIADPFWTTGERYREYRRGFTRPRGRVVAKTEELSDAAAANNVGPRASSRQREPHVGSGAV